MNADMIDHEIQHVHMPRPIATTSPASETVWAAFDPSLMVGWNGGRLSFPALNPLDNPNSQAVFEEYPKGDIPSVFYDMITSIDLCLPPAEEMLDVLDAHVLVQNMESPAFAIPREADVTDVARCLVAARILFYCLDELIMPTSVTLEEFEEALETACLNALVIGGLGVYPIAMRIAKDPDFWRLIAAPGRAGEDFEG